ncbi:hypothetical protein GCM10023220_23390 [Streptomyces ziwulingensis]|uniref:Uncharacterized protein n=1 Tax=Streptomyces ziwulingensis TaxID=1045501 RepID=A0ABP9BI58_9ACTN
MSSAPRPSGRHAESLSAVGAATRSRAAFWGQLARHQRVSTVLGAVSEGARFDAEDAMSALDIVTPQGTGTPPLRGGAKWLIAVGAVRSLPTRWKG